MKLLPHGPLLFTQFLFGKSIITIGPNVQNNMLVRWQDLCDGGHPFLVIHCKVVARSCYTLTNTCVREWRMARLLEDSSTVLYKETLGIRIPS